MPIFRVSNPTVGQRHLREWYRGILHMVALLFAAVVACAIGLMLLVAVPLGIVYAGWLLAWQLTITLESGLSRWSTSTPQRPKTLSMVASRLRA